MPFSKVPWKCLQGIIAVLGSKREPGERTELHPVCEKSPMIEPNFFKPLENYFIVCGVAVGDIRSA